MGLFDALFKTKREANPIIEIDQDLPDFVCEECGIKPPTMYEVDDLLVCVECAESHLRRERFKAEDAEWNSVDSK